MGKVLREGWKMLRTLILGRAEQSSILRLELMVIMSGHAAHPVTEIVGFRAHP